MLIVCPNCTTWYDIDPVALGSGRSVRCARCRTIWRAALPELTERRNGGEWRQAESTPDTTGSGPRAEPFAAEPLAADDAPGADLVAADVPAAVADAPPLAPEHPAFSEPSAAADAAPRPPQDVEGVAARRARIGAIGRPRRRWLRPRLASIIVLLAAAAAGLIVWRAPIVRAAPQSARLYALIGLPVNLRGLMFEDVRTSEEVHEGVPVLVVAGRLVNIAAHSVDVPRLRFALRNAAGLEIFAWTAVPPRSALAAGQALAFRSRHASPPADARDVVVRFFHRRDLEAGR